MVDDIIVENIEKSFLSFEYTNNLKIVFNDFSGKLSTWLLPERRYHNYSICILNKTADNSKNCVNCDIANVLKYLSNSRDCFYKLCPGKIIEIVSPIYIRGFLLGVIYLGPFSGIGENNLPPNSFSITSPRMPLIKIKSHLSKLSNISKINTFHLYQMTKMLRNHLEYLISNADIAERYTAPREWQIKNFFLNRSSEAIKLKDLAQELFLSESRTSHILKDLYNKSFPELLAIERLNKAKRLMEISFISVNNIASRVGFSDPSYFYKSFKKYEKIKPLEYRNIVNKKKIIGP